MPEVSELYIYPIKSLGGIRLQSAVMTDRGLEHDRRWMLTDPGGRFLTRRELPAMALLQVALTSTGLRVYQRNNPHHEITIPLQPENSARVQTEIWGNTCEALTVSPAADAWFSRQLDTDCRLVYMPDDSRLAIDEKYYSGGITSLSDGYPVLMVSDASLKLLNQRAGLTLEMARFRPNLVISGCSAHEEDRMARMDINGVILRGVKPCARCVVTTQDPETGAKGKEPLQTLATYRKLDNKLYFGENVVPLNTGIIRVGDAVRVLEWKEGPEFKKRGEL